MERFRAGELAASGLGWESASGHSKEGIGWILARDLLAAVTVLACAYNESQCLCEVAVWQSSGDCTY